MKSTKQITKAMQLVAASKLRRAQEAALGPRAYADMARRILVSLRFNASDDAARGLFEPRTVKKRLLVVITGDRGLAGAYNANIVRRMIAEAAKDRQNGVDTSVVCIGKQAARAASRIRDLDVRAVYSELPDKPTPDTLRPILLTITSLFIDGTVDAVDFINTKFVSTVVQTVRVQRFLPAGFKEPTAQSGASEVVDDLRTATIEPSRDVLLQSTVTRLLDAQIYQALLEAAASEHSMRMLAMKNATDNASDIIDDLTLEYNNARQAAITQELAEITGGAEAIK